MRSKGVIQQTNANTGIDHSLGMLCGLDTEAIYQVFFMRNITCDILIGSTEPVIVALNHPLLCSSFIVNVMKTATKCHLGKKENLAVIFFFFLNFLSYEQNMILCLHIVHLPICSPVKQRGVVVTIFS